MHFISTGYRGAIWVRIWPLQWIGQPMCKFLSFYHSHSSLMLVRRRFADDKGHGSPGRDPNFELRLFGVHAKAGASSRLANSLMRNSPIRACCSYTAFSKYREHSLFRFSLHNRKRFELQSVKVGRALLDNSVHGNRIVGCLIVANATNTSKAFLMWSVMLRRASNNVIIIMHNNRQTERQIGYCRILTAAPL